MIINIAEIISTAFISKTYNAHLDSETFVLRGTRYVFENKDPIKLKISNIGEQEVSLEADIHVVLDIPCDRCLEAVHVPFDLEVTRKLDFKASPIDRINNLDETSYIDGSNLDVDLFVFNEILLGFPMKVLCRFDCRGICYRCGVSLNGGECQCDKDSTDPRMSAIQDIFNNFKEV